MKTGGTNSTTKEEEEEEEVALERFGRTEMVVGSCPWEGGSSRWDRGKPQEALIGKMNLHNIWP